MMYTPHPLARSLPFDGRIEDGGFIVGIVSIPYTSFVDTLISECPCCTEPLSESHRAL